MSSTSKRQMRQNSAPLTPKFQGLRIERRQAGHSSLTVQDDDVDVGFALDRLSVEFATYRTLDSEAKVTEHWNERRREAKWLLDYLPKTAGSAKTLISEEAYLESRFEVRGTGRHTPDAIGANSTKYIRGLQDLCDILKTLEPTLNEIKCKRKLRIDDDENFFLYLMAAVKKFYGGVCSTAAIHREIARFVNAQLVSLKGEDQGIDVKEVARRIDRYRSRNSESADAIDANPAKFLLHVYGVTPHAGLRRG